MLTNEFFASARCLALWRAGLAEHDEMEGIAWRWHSAQGTRMKTPLAKGSGGPNQTNRGQKGKQADAVGGRAWHPAVDHRHRGQSS
jgi:hypothetical protein